MTQRDFARLLGKSTSYVYKVRHGLRPPPAADVDGWADHLRLGSNEREAFLAAAGLAHVPHVLRERLSKYLPKG